MKYPFGGFTYFHHVLSVGEEWGGGASFMEFKVDPARGKTA